MLEVAFIVFFFNAQAFLSLDFSVPVSCLYSAVLGAMASTILRVQLVASLDVFQGNPGTQAAYTRVRTTLDAETLAFVRSVRPVPGTQGRQLRLDTTPEANAEAVDQLCRGIQSLGNVVRIQEQEAQDQRRIDQSYRQAREREANGMLTAEAASRDVSCLLALRGDGGSSKKKRRFAEKSMDVLAASQRVALASHSKRLSKVACEEQMAEGMDDDEE